MPQTQASSSSPPAPSSTALPDQGITSPPSVFNALGSGSYADRIRDANGKIIHTQATHGTTANGSGSKATSSHVTPSSTLGSLTMPSSSSASGSTSRATKSAKAPTPAVAEKEAPKEEEGAWETVQSGRTRTRASAAHSGSHEEDKRTSAANTSRNWRERPQKDKDGKDGKDGEEGKKSGSRSRKSGEKAGSSSIAAAGSSTGSTATSQPTSRTQTPVTTSNATQAKDKETKKTPVSTTSTKPAWGIVPPVASSMAQSMPSTTRNTQSTPSSSNTPASASASTNTTKSDEVRKSRTTSSNGTATHRASEPISSTTAAASVDAKADSEDERRGVEDKDVQDIKDTKGKEVKETQGASSRPAVAPPAVNPWDIRKKNLSSTISPSTSTSANGSSLATAGHAAPESSSSPAPAASSSGETLVNGDMKAGPGEKSKKKKKTVEPGPVADPSLWPDVAQAAEVAKKEEEKKETIKVRKDSDEEGVNDDAHNAAKKPKWKSIPAAELQAAADAQAETQRRQVAAKKRQSKVEAANSGQGGPAASGNGVPPKPKTSARKTSDGKPAPVPNGLPNRLPPNPNAAFANQRTAGLPASGQSQGSSQGGKPVFENARSNRSDVGGLSGGEGGRQPSISAPMSRQTSSQSRGSNRRMSATQLSSPSGNLTDPKGALSKPMSGTASAPSHTSTLPPLTSSGPGTFSRQGRGRDGRGSFSRPRGGPGYRKHMPGGFTSPIMSANGLPADQAYARAYGMNFGTFYPAGMNGAGASGNAAGSNGSPNGTAPMSQFGSTIPLDPMQAQYSMQMYSRGGAPPPPMPQTNVPGIEPQQFYVLGQVEYYFSMQNLAMDFFLRQQMDSEGWIDISMIASFNRLRSLTPDLDTVKEVMGLSSLLEVRENKVRLAGQESKRWVLPDAKPSTFPPDPESDSQPASTPSRDDHSQVLSDQEISELTLGVSGLAGLSGYNGYNGYMGNGLGMEDVNGLSGIKGMNGGAAMPKYAPGDVENALMKSSIPTSSTVSVSNGGGVESVEGEVGDESMEKAEGEGEGEGGEEELTPATSMSGDHAEGDLAEKVEVR